MIDRIAFFAYGAWMSSTNLKGACGDWSLRGQPAQARGWRTAIDALGAMNLVASEHDHAWGVLWHVEPRHLEILDQLEGVPRGRYQRTQIAIGVEARTVVASVYISDHGASDKSSFAYSSVVISGAIEHQLPLPYIEHLASLAQAWRVIGARTLCCEPW